MQKFLNNITNEDLTEIESLAALFYVPVEIALMLQIEKKTFLDEMEKEESEVYCAFQKGRLQSDMELRRSIIKLSKSGSSPAQTMALDLLNKSKLKMLDR